MAEFRNTHGGGVEVLSHGVWRGVPSEAAAEIASLRAKLFDAGLWLRTCLDFVEGGGPPNWDGIREFLKSSD